MDGPTHELYGPKLIPRQSPSIGRAVLSHHGQASMQIVLLPPHELCSPSSYKGMAHPYGVQSSITSWMGQHTNCASVPDIPDGPVHALHGLPFIPWLGPSMSYALLPDILDGPPHELCGPSSYKGMAHPYGVQSSITSWMGQHANCASVPDIPDGPVHALHSLPFIPWLGLSMSYALLPDILDGPISHTKAWPVHKASTSVVLPYLISLMGPTHALHGLPSYHGWACP
ncbi:hypothetical protein EDC04DRAFT_2605638 [Pisolithus marmoratus]|nr:hypothetical protein EDC04DRAFT_2605638 [Pisolithus marmoratus]